MSTILVKILSRTKTRYNTMNLNIPNIWFLLIDQAFMILLMSLNPRLINILIREFNVFGYMKDQHLETTLQMFDELENFIK